MNLETINWVDIVLGGAVLISALIGIARGLIKEVLSLLAWVIAIWVAWKFADMVADKYIRGLIDDPTISYLAAFGGLFLVSMFALGLFNMLISSFLASSGLGGIDRMLGMVFGLLRGLIIAAGLVFVGKFIPPVHEMKMWQESKLQPTFGALVEWGIAKLPDNVRKLLNTPHESARPQSAPQIPADSADAGIISSTSGQQPTRPQHSAQTQAMQSRQTRNIAETGSSAPLSLTSMENEPPPPPAQPQNGSNPPPLTLESAQGQ